MSMIKHHPFIRGYRTNRAGWAFVLSLAMLLVATTGTTAFAQKKKGGGGSGGEPATGNIFYFDANANCTMAMRPDGSGKVRVLPSVSPGHLLFPDDADPSQPYPLTGMPCDQAHGQQPLLDRWFLTMVRTGTYEELTLTSGRTLYNQPHHDVFAFRTLPTNRDQVAVVRLTDLYGSFWIAFPWEVLWSNDSNESDFSFISGFVGRPMNGGIADDDTVSLRLPITATDVQAAWLTGANIAVGAAAVPDLVVPAPLGAPWTSPDGLAYAGTSNNRQILLYDSFDDTVPPDLLWDGYAGIQPRRPGILAWSRDGNTLAFMNTGLDEYSSGGGIWTMPVSGETAPKQVLSNTSTGNKYRLFTAPQWSPDSRHLVVRFENYDGTKGSSQFALYVMPAAGGSPVAVTPNAAQYFTISRWVSDALAPALP